MHIMSNQFDGTVAAHAHISNKYPYLLPSDRMSKLQRRNSIKLCLPFCLTESATGSF